MSESRVRVPPFPPINQRVARDHFLRADETPPESPPAASRRLRANRPDEDSRGGSPAILLSKGIRHRIAAVPTEVTTGHFRPGSCLPAFEFSEAEQPCHFANRVGVIPFGNEPGHAPVTLDERIENAVQEIIRRQAVLVGLPFAQLRGRWLG